jgi:hypothetical protein
MTQIGFYLPSPKTSVSGFFPGCQSRHYFRESPPFKPKFSWEKSERRAGKRCLGELDPESGSGWSPVLDADLAPVGAGHGPGKAQAKPGAGLGAAGIAAIETLEDVG